jgi:hypothetical protein
MTGAGPKGRSPEKQSKQSARGRRRPLTVFIHIPKTAGTTLSGVLQTNCPPDAFWRLGNVFKGSAGADEGKLAQIQASGPKLAWKTRTMHVLAGHFPFGVREYLPADARYITLLRDPVARTLSQYSGALAEEAIPRDASFEDVLAAGTYIYDNLQTRMLCGDIAPFGPVTDEMLERAKENLRTEFLAFGLVDRFDESLVLFQRRLGLRSILYVDQRVASRSRKVRDGFVEIAESFNRYDIELYRWACEHFDDELEGEGAELQLEVAALQRAHDGEAASGVPPPPATELSRGRMWKLLVASRAELLQRDHELAEARARERAAVRLERVLRRAEALEPIEAEGPGREASLAAIQEFQRLEDVAKKVRKRLHLSDHSTESSVRESDKMRRPPRDHHLD